VLGRRVIGEEAQEVSKSGAEQRGGRKLHQSKALKCQKEKPVGSRLEDKQISGTEDRKRGGTLPVSHLRKKTKTIKKERQMAESIGVRKKKGARNPIVSRPEAATLGGGKSPSGSS